MAFQEWGTNGRYRPPARAVPFGMQRPMGLLRGPAIRASWLQRSRGGGIVIMGKLLREKQVGLFAFLIVLLFMPLGHALMVLNERVLHGGKYPGAFLMGAVGVALLAWGVRSEQKAIKATLLGLVAGILVWTGWVEFSFVWVAEKLQVAPLMENGEVATKPEYLVMLSSIGLLGVFLVMFLFITTRCTFFAWCQRALGLQKQLRPASRANISRPVAVITFIETVMLIWTFYIVLLVVYDPAIAGDRHPATFLVAIGSLAWSLFLIRRLLRIKIFDQAVRYAVPTVVIFWNFIEILGRWNFFHEIWVHPMEYWLENAIILAMLLGFVVYVVAAKVGVRRSRLEKAAMADKATKKKSEHRVPSRTMPAHP